jgi:hypothetical protein
LEEVEQKKIIDNLNNAAKVRCKNNKEQLSAA